MKKFKNLLLILFVLFMAMFCTIGCGERRYEESAGTYYSVQYGVCDQEYWITLSSDKTWTDGEGTEGTYTLSSNSIVLKIENEEWFEGTVSDGVLQEENGLFTYMTSEACQREGISGCYVTEETALYTRDGNSIYFGQFPQSVKAENVEVTEEPDENGYYQDKQGNNYIKAQAKKSDSWQDYTLDFTDHREIVDGEYYYFKLEPLRWTVLEEADGTALLWCRNIVWAMEFQSQFALDESLPEDASCRYFITAENAPEGTPANNYYYSDVRAWLNNDFYNTAFSEEQKEIILSETLDNGKTSTLQYTQALDEFLCENTVDNVFLLSEADIRNSDYNFPSQQIPDSYYGNGTHRIRAVTDYAKTTGMSFIPREVANNSAAYSYASAAHMLRTPDDTAGGKRVQTVSAMALVAPEDIKLCGVVPALRINLQKTTAGLKCGYNTDKTGYIIFSAEDKNIEQLIIPSKIDGMPVVGITENSFAECANLKELVIPKNVTTIGNSAFANCESLTSVVIGDGVKTIGEHAFRGCDLTEVTYMGTIDQWVEIEFGKGANPIAYTEELYIHDELITKVELTTATKIGDSAFAYCRSLTEVVIPNSVTSIGSSAFV